MPPTGPVKIVRANIDNHFGRTRISQHGGEFRMYQDIESGFKVTISSQDALWIIDKLQLGATVVPPFRRTVTWARD
jgi:hypothetical protein